MIIDCTLRESARAKVKFLVKRIVNEFGEPVDFPGEAVMTVLARSEMLCTEWVSE